MLLIKGLLPICIHRFFHLSDFQLYKTQTYSWGEYTSCFLFKGRNFSLRCKLLTKNKEADEITIKTKMSKKQIPLGFYKISNLITQSNLDDKKKKKIIKLTSSIEKALEIKQLSKTTLEELKELEII